MNRDEIKKPHSNDFGRLLCQPDMRDFKHLYRIFSATLLIPGILIIIHLMILLVTDFKALINGWAWILFLPFEAVLLFTGGWTLHQSLVAKLQIYENGFTDHFYSANTSRTRRVCSYFVKYDILYARNGCRKMIVIRSGGFKATEKAFDIVVDALKNELVPEEFPVVQYDLFDDLAYLNDESIQFRLSNVDAKYSALKLALLPWLCTSIFALALIRDIMFFIIVSVSCMPICGFTAWVEHYCTPWDKQDVIKIYPDMLLFWPYSQRRGLSVNFSRVYRLEFINLRSKKGIVLFHNMEKKCKTILTASASEDRDEKFQRLFEEIQSRIPPQAKVIMK